jgi:predicted component of type VI protein secretion system
MPLRKQMPFAAAARLNGNPEGTPAATAVRVMLIHDPFD